jgi:hypothetical protein
MMYWRVLLLCLAVLLPWRSTLAVTMAMASTHHSMPASMEQAPCPHHASASDLSSSPDEMAHHASCDVCHVPALSADLRTANPPHVHPIEPPPLSERFASVVVALHHKPPILV